MNKTKVEVYKELLKEILQNFEGEENFIKQRREETYERKKKVC